MGDHIQKHAFFIDLCIDLKPLADVFHQRLLIVRIVDGKIRGKSDVVDKTAENADTG